MKSHDPKTCETLCCVQVGGTARVAGTNFGVEDAEGVPDLMRRLLHLGFVSGEMVKVVKRAPLFQDPLLVQVRGSQIALTEWEASKIIVDR